MVSVPALPGPSEGPQGSGCAEGDALTSARAGPAGTAGL